MKIVLKTGINMDYVEQGNLNGETIIFLHGLTDSWFSYSMVLPNILSKYHLYALTQRGHGDTDKPVCGYCLDDFVNDLKGFMDQLNIEKATIVGHSMGSFIGHKFAVLYPERVSGLVLIGSAPTAAGNQTLIEYLKTIKTLEDPIDRGFVVEFQTGPNPYPEEFFNTVVSESMKVPANVWKKAFAGLIEDDHSDQLKQIAAPALIFWGDKDGYFEREEQDKLADLIPNASLVIYEETGHNLHWEKPKEFAKDLEIFLKK